MGNKKNIKNVPRKKKNKNKFQDDIDELENIHFRENQTINVSDDVSKISKKKKKLLKIFGQKTERKFDDSGQIAVLEKSKRTVKKPYKLTKKAYKGTKNQAGENFDKFKEKKAIREITETGNFIYNSRPVKLAKKPLSTAGKLITSKAVWNSFGLVRAGVVAGIGVAAIAGASGVAAIVAPQIAIPIAVASTAAIGVSVAVDTYKVRKIRKLYQEDKHLNRFHQSRDLQTNILRENKGLKAALGDELTSFDTKGKKSKKRQHKSKIENTSQIKSTLRGGVEIGIKAGVAVTESILYLNPVSLVANLAIATVGFVSGSEYNFSMSKITKTLQTDVKELNQDPDCVGYNSLTDLKKKTRTQKIQTLALKKLTTDPEFSNYSPEQQKSEFKKIKQEIEQQEKKVRKGNSAVELLKDVGRAHNPFSNYNNPEDLKKRVNINIDQERDLRINQSKTTLMQEKTTIAHKKLDTRIDQILSKIKDKKIKISPEDNSKNHSISPPPTVTTLVKSDNKSRDR